MDVAVTANFEFLIDNKARITLLQGGSRSGKTYSCCQWIIYYCLGNTGKIITIARDNLVVNKRTVFLDFIQILKMTGVDYSLNKSEMIVTLNSNIIRFVGLDENSKVLGMKQDICYVNEGLNINKDIYLQLLQRTSEQLIVDFNPSMIKHFLYDWADTRDDCTLFKSTIFDNPMAPPEAIKQILGYEPNEYNDSQGNSNEYYWKIFGLGERFRGDDVVIRKFWRYSEELDDADVEWSLIGADFGYMADPTVLVQVKKQKNSKSIYCRVLLWETGLTNQMIAERIFSNPNIDKGLLQIWDSSERKSIAELRMLGVSATPATKGAHSIYYGVQKMQGFDIYVYADNLSNHLAKELEEMRFQTDGNGDFIRDTKGCPKLVDAGNHATDSIRYALEKYVVNT